jgi:hypothetical protein
VYSLQEWLQLDDPIVVEIIARRVSTTVVYLNGTRRWFLSQSNNWADYAKTTGVAHRQLCELFYTHGIQTLIQPLMGYDLLSRGQDYLQMAVEQGLAELTTTAYQDWFHRVQISLTLYGNWSATLMEMGFTQVAASLEQVVEITSHYTKHRLLLGVFADESLDHIVALAKKARGGKELLQQYYGQPVGPVDLIVGSGQPAIWDLPLLDINKANLYFLQAPTFCLDKTMLRRIFYDHLYQRTNDDKLYDNLTPKEWEGLEVLGLGQRTRKGWTPT